MTQKEAKATLVKAFRALPKADRARLRWHAEKGTPICCGADADTFADGKGAG